MSNKYRFPADSVKSCPANAKQWEEAARRRNCSLNPNVIRNRYQCVPNAKKTTLLEFCYDDPRPLVQNGKQKPWFVKKNMLFVLLEGMYN